LSADYTVPTYSSAGVLQHRFTHQIAQAGSERNSDFYVFYFAGRPVATLDNVAQGTVGSLTTSTWQYLTVDHLGTPILVNDSAGTQVWQGGFEPFGADYSSSPTVLRFPGQWVDGTWNGNQGVGLYYNVQRWYEVGRGRYTRPDPLGQRGDLNPFTYANSTPSVAIDPTGERARLCCTPITESGILARFFHCFVQVQSDTTNESETYSLHGMGNGRRNWGGPLGCKFKGDGFDHAALEDTRTECGDWVPGCTADECVRKSHSAYPSPVLYTWHGPNSNTYAQYQATTCNLSLPRIASTLRTPGLGDAIPSPTLIPLFPWRPAYMTCPSVRRSY
jgi:RHS repeat-associated protein